MFNEVDSCLLLCALSDYIPVMTEAEIFLILNGRMNICPEMIYRWERLLQSMDFTAEKRIREAYAKQR